MDTSGLAEAGLIESRLSRCNRQLDTDEHNGPFYFSPERYALLKLVFDIYFVVTFILLGQHS